MHWSQCLFAVRTIERKRASLVIIPSIRYMQYCDAKRTGTGGRRIMSLSDVTVVVVVLRVSEYVII